MIRATQSQNIIFRANNFNALPEDIKKMYKLVGKEVWALDPGQMRIDKGNLPRYISTEQYERFKTIVEPYYRAVSYGFGANVAKLYGLKPQFAYDWKHEYANAPLPAGSRITELEYHKLPAAKKVLYKKASSKGAVYYYLASDELPRVPKQIASSKSKEAHQVSAVRPPTIGIKVPPIGRWLEQK